MSLPFSSSTPADDPMKKEECHKAAAAIKNMLEKVQSRKAYNVKLPIIPSRISTLYIDVALDLREEEEPREAAAAAVFQTFSKK